MRISKSDAKSFPRFALLPDDFFVVDSLCFFTGNDLLYLQGVLNSEFAAYYFFKNIAILDNGGMQMRQQYIELMPIPLGTVEHKKKLSELVGKNQTTHFNIENDKIIDDIIYAIYSFDVNEINFIRNFIQNKIKEINSIAGEK